MQLQNHSAKADSSADSVTFYSAATLVAIVGRQKKSGFWLALIDARIDSLGSIGFKKSKAEVDFIMNRGDGMS
jgi:hypothetical protein